MTSQEIECIQHALETVGLVYNKFPKKIEIKIPKAKYPGIYLCIPTDGRSFKLQVYFQQIGIAFIEKLNTRGFVLAGDDMSKSINLTELKNVPLDEELIDILNAGLEKTTKIGVAKVAVPELV